MCKHGKRIPIFEINILVFIVAANVSKTDIYDIYIYISMIRHLSKQSCFLYCFIVYIECVVEVPCLHHICIINLH